MNAEELVLSATPGKNYPTSGQALFYMDNLEIKASGALATNPGIQPAGISVYPNSANEVINIYIPEMTDTPPIRLVDATGRSIGLTINSLGQGGFRFDTSALAPGLYFFWIVSGSTRQTRRIFITH